MLLNKNDKWTYTRVGGVTRVAIASGDDIARLGELDLKKWTVLSCPVKNLEFDAKTLAFLDTDADGIIRAEDVALAAKWLTSAVADKDSLLLGKDSISLDEFSSSETGEALKANASTILNNIGKPDASSICIADVADYSACQAAEEIDKATIFPYGDDTPSALEAYDALNEKVEDFFTRCKLLCYDADTAAATSVAISDISQIAGCPIAKPNDQCILPLDAINPAWLSLFEKVRKLVLEHDFPEAGNGINEQQWQSVAAKLSPYRAWKNEKSVFVADQSVVEIDKFLHLYCYFYKFLRNYVNFSDFYSLDHSVRATFEAGDLFIDERCCRLCIKVDDMSKHADMAQLSGMFLIYCSCTSKDSSAKMDIVAAMTKGDIKNLRPGKNGVFYDRKGNDWDAVVTKIVDNPINIRQAFFAPYRKFWAFCVSLINKSAQEKDSQVLSDMQTKATDVKNGGTKATGFDIARFAGIFAALGMAIGFIGQALVALATGIAALKFWQLLLVILALMLLISGPSCFLAWGKLRRRNLGPVLNASGWAINSVVLVNIMFGATLTSVASYPKLRVKDPYKKVVPVWKRILSWFILLSLSAGLFLFFSGRLASVGLPYRKGACVEAITKLGSDFQSGLQGAVDAGRAAADSVAVPAAPAQ